MLPRLLRTQGRCARHRYLVLGLPPRLWAGLRAPLLPGSAHAWLPRERHLEGVETTDKVLAEVFCDDVGNPWGQGALRVPLGSCSAAPDWGALQWGPIPPCPGPAAQFPQQEVQLVTLQPALQCPHPPASRPRRPCRTLGTESDHRAPAVAVWAGAAGVAAPHTHRQMDGQTDDAK